MLAEIFILRLEAMLRASEQADREKNCRFAPFADNVRIAPTGPEKTAGMVPTQMMSSLSLLTRFYKAAASNLSP
jgi:hypothetical protein